MDVSPFVKPQLIKTHQLHNQFYLYDSESLSEFSPEVLNAKYWQSQQKVVGTAIGRGTTYFIKHEENQWVLRHYYRGGLIGKIIDDSYLFTGLAKTRAFAEFNLLAKMYQHGLPVPKPIACRVEQTGVLYRADLLTARVENARDLVGLLQQGAIPTEVWLAIGKMIAKFHQLGIYHHDLNSHNILLDDQQKPWLIDFDRGEQRATENIELQKWPQQNLARLLRSFEKELGKLANFHWQKENWQQLMNGYRQQITS